MSLPEHIGMPLLEAERQKLLNAYDIALQQVENDPVKVDHGNVGEASFINFLRQFLPMKYGVAKGFIVTPDRSYDNKLEEWDIIIYDALEAPVLFVRQSAADSRGRHGIPVEYVRGVIEVKAALNSDSASAVTEKLQKLLAYRNEIPEHPPNPVTIRHNLYTAAVFYETRVASPKAYSDCLGRFSPLQMSKPCFDFTSLIIRGQNHSDRSAFLFFSQTGATTPMAEGNRIGLEWSMPVTPDYSTDNLYTVSGGFGRSEFWFFMFHMLDRLNEQSGPRDFSIVPPIHYAGKVAQDVEYLFPDDEPYLPLGIRK